MRHAVGTGRLRVQRLPVDREYGYDRVADRLAGMDRLHEHVLAAVQPALDQHAEISDDDQPVIGWRFAAVATVALAFIAACFIGTVGRRVRSRISIRRQRCRSLLRDGLRLRLGGSLLLFHGRVVARQVQQEYAVLAFLQVLREI